MKRLYSFLFIFTFLQAFAADGQINPSDSIPVDPEVRVGQLRNGLKYYVRRNSVADGIVHMRLVVKAGSMEEEAGQLGIAHFMEHMNFNGVEGYPKEEIINYLNSAGVQLGSDLNAYTSYDETVFVLPIPGQNKRAVDQGFAIMEGWAAHALLDTAQVNKERGVIMEESRIRKGADQRFRDQYLPLILGGSRFAYRQPIGKDSLIKKFTAADIRQFYRTWYRPDLMAVIVVGDIDPDSAIAEITRRFGPLTNPKNEKALPKDGVIAGRKAPVAMLLKDKEAVNTELRLYFNSELDRGAVTWAGDRDKMVERLLINMLNNRLVDMSSRPGSSFKYPSVRNLSTIPGWKILGVSAFPVGGSVDSAIAGEIRALESIRTLGFSQAELERAKSVILNDYSLDNDNYKLTDSRRLVQEYINNFLWQEPIPGYRLRYDFYKDEIPGISLADIEGAFGRIFRPDRLAVVVTAPAQPGIHLPSANQVLALIDKTKALPAVPYSEAPEAVLEGHPLNGGTITHVSMDSSLGLTNLTLSNGITITLKPTKFKTGEIKMDAWRPGGFHQAPLEDRFSAMEAANLVNEMGIEGYSPHSIDRLTEDKSIYVQPYINDDEDGVQGNSSSKGLSTFLQLIYLYFTKPANDSALGKGYIAAQSALSGKAFALPQVFLDDSLNRMIYQNNPWTSDDLLSESDWQKVNVDNAFLIYKKIFGNADGLHFTFVGDFDPDSIQSALAYWIGGLPSFPAPHHFVDVHLRPIQGNYKIVLKRGLDRKTVLELVSNGVGTYSQEEQTKLEITAMVLQLEVNELLRQKMGKLYAEVFRSTMTKEPFAEYTINMTFWLAPQNLDTILHYTTGIINRLRDEGPTADVLEKVKAIFQEHTKADLGENYYWLVQLSHAWLQGESYGSILHRTKIITDVTVDDVRETVRKYFQLDKFVEAILEPEQTGSAY
jgi:zinc protease